MRNILYQFSIILLCVLGGTLQPVSAQSPTGNAASSLEGQIRFVEEYDTINSFDEVLERFPQQTVYIDLWATWCGPCVSEFRYKDPLHQFAQQHGILLLYISLDQDSADHKWKSLVEERQISGYHMRASKALSKDIVDRFSQLRNGRPAFGIPYYLIAKNGEIVLDKAPRPSSTEILYTELLNYSNP